MSPLPQRRTYFVSGTDTDVGKTLVSCLLLHAAAARGLDTIGMKPLAAGAVATPDGLRNEDALQLMQASTRKLSYEQVNPVCLPDALSPHLAARAAGRRVGIDRLAGFCQGVLMQRAGFTLIEGAGGWRVPISDREFLSDLARTLKLPVLLVVGLRLGCLNHAMLTAEAIHRDGLSLAGWIANTLDPDMRALDDNVATLKEALGAPLLGVIPRLPQPVDPAAHAALLDLAPLGL